jgi:hypothetical protein
MHRDGTLDLFSMAGVLSFNSFGIFKPRFTVKWLDKNGSESTFPASRYHIAKFLEGGQPNLRIYAQTASKLKDRIQFATKHFNGMGIRPTWNHFITVPQRTPLATHNITQVSEFNLVCFQQAVDADGNVIIESDELGQFLNDAGLKDPTERETNITSITPLHVLVQVANMDGDLISSDDFFGDTAGREIEEGDRAEGCQTPNRNDECCILVQRTQNRRQLGSGVAMRNVYPGYFSKMVMAHRWDTISVSVTSTITAYRTSCSRMPPAIGLGTVWLLLECRAVLHQQRQEECVALHRRPAGQRAIASAQFGEVAISATRQAIYAGLR